MAQKNFTYALLCSLLMFLFLCEPGMAADVNRDSLIQVLKDAPANSFQRAQILQQLSASYHQDAPDESIFYGEELIHLAGALGSSELLYLGKMSTGVAYAIKGNFPETALRHFIDALDIAKKERGEEWELRRVKSRINIAGVHWQLENIGPALAYAYENVAQLKSMDDPLTLADAYRTVALMHRTAEDYDSTFIYLNKALEIYEAEEEHHRRAFTLITLGNTYQKTGLYEKAQQVLYQARQHALLHQDATLLRDTYQGLSSTYLQLNRVDSAEYYARQLMEVASENGLLPELAESYKLLSELFTTTNQLDSALYYHQLYAKMREQVIGDEKAKVIQEMDTKYQAQEKARENRQLRQQYALARFRNTFLAVSSILFLLLVAAISFYYYRLRRKNAELKKLNEEISSMHSGQVTLMNEKRHMVSLIAHDIRNPLSLIQVNTHTLAHSAGLDNEEQKNILAEIEQATNDIDRATLKIMEVENKTQSPITIRSAPIDLVLALKESIREFTPFARSKSIDLIFASHNEQGAITGDPFLIRHIIANLLSNAIKYSPPGKKVELSFRDNGKEVAFSVKDYGAGLSQKEQRQLFQKGTTFYSVYNNSGRSLGEGLYLTRRYVEAMGGKITVESQPGQGALFTVGFSKEKTGLVAGHSSQ